MQKDVHRSLCLIGTKVRNIQFMLIVALKSAEAQSAFHNRDQDF